MAMTLEDQALQLAGTILTRRDLYTRIQRTATKHAINASVVRELEACTAESFSLLQQLLGLIADCDSESTDRDVSPTRAPEVR